PCRYFRKYGLILALCRPRLDFPVSPVVSVLNLWPTVDRSQLQYISPQPRPLAMSDQPIHAHGPVVTEGTMAPSHGVPGAHDVHEHHSGGIAKYIYVFIALCFLTTLSFLTYFPWWRHNFTPAESRMLMMAVSCSKALLVILCFMHIWWEANWK